MRLPESGEEEQVCDRINNPAAYPSKNLGSSLLPNSSISCTELTLKLKDNMQV